MQKLLHVVLLLCAFAVAADENRHNIPMYENGAETYYINGSLAGAGNSRFMVDTGSGYTVINEVTLEKLQSQGKAQYIGQLVGKLADGTHKKVPVYQIEQITLGEHCQLNNIQAAVFPGDTRHILGINTLKKAGSFTFGFNPPTLTLTSCQPV